MYNQYIITHYYLVYLSLPAKEMENLWLAFALALAVSHRAPLLALQPLTLLCTESTLLDIWFYETKLQVFTTEEVMIVIYFNRNIFSNRDVKDSRALSIFL